MRKIFLILVLSLLAAGNVSLAQSDYLSKGRRSAAAGNYDEAVAQFTAAKSMLAVKKVNVNSKEFIDVERLLKAASDCRECAGKADVLMKRISDQAIAGAFASCKSAAAVQKVRSDLLACVAAARGELKNILSRFPEDKRAQGNLAACNRAEARIATVSKNFLAEKERLAKEPETWQLACETGTEQAYEGYLAVYPDGPHSADAAECITRLRDEAAAALRHKEEVDADEIRWNAIKYSESAADFLNYIASDGYKGHEEEANAYANLFLSRNLPLTVNTAQNVVDNYREARRFMSLSDADLSILSAAEELAAYKRFCDSAAHGLTEAPIVDYLNSFPNGAHRAEVSDAYAMFLMNELIRNGVVTSKDKILSYATTRQTVSYIKANYNKAAKAAKSGSWYNRF